jgi:hypothetical protein
MSFLQIVHFVNIVIHFDCWSSKNHDMANMQLSNPLDCAPSIAHYESVKYPKIML